MLPCRGWAPGTRFSRIRCCGTFDSVGRTWSASSPAASASISIASGTSFSATPSRFTEASRVHYAELYALPGAMHSGFAQFAAFDQDALDNRAFIAAQGKLTMPVLAIGGEKSFGPMMATVMRFAASDVTEAVIPDSGHWIMEENPTVTVAMVRDFIGKGLHDPRTIR